MDMMQSTTFFVSWSALLASVFFVLIGGSIGWLLSFRKMKRIQQDAVALSAGYKEKLATIELDVQEAERRRIAADLHDHIISKLALLRLSNTNSLELNAALGDIIEEVRHLCHDLMPPLYEEMNIEEILMSIVGSWKPHYDIQYRTDIRARVTDNRLKLQIARIFQELLTNVHKHAQARSILVNLRITGSSIAVMVSDDGIGFDGAGRRAGIGLCNLELRVEGVGGQYKFKKSVGGGTRFIFFMKADASSNLTIVDESAEVQYY